MKQNYPDYGMFMKKRLRTEVNYTFAAFKLFGLDRIGEQQYSTTSNIHPNGTCFAVTIDFSESQYLELLEIIPKSLADILKQIFSHDFLNAQCVDFPCPIDVRITATIGEVINNGEEEFAPFQATQVSPVQK